MENYPQQRNQEHRRKLTTGSDSCRLIQKLSPRRPCCCSASFPPTTTITPPLRPHPTYTTPLWLLTYPCSVVGHLSSQALTSNRLLQLLDHHQHQRQLLRTSLLSSLLHHYIRQNMTEDIPWSRKDKVLSCSGRWQGRNGIC